jgi:hypothetical protein
MIERRDTPNKTPAEVELIGEERERQRRDESTALQRISLDLAAGQAIFRGRVDDVDGSELRATAQRLVTDRIQEIYPLLDQFTANLRRDDVLLVLRTTDLGTVDGSLLGDGIGLVRVTPTGYELVTDSGPLSTLAAEVRARASYGQEPTGAYLERHFADPPYGAPVEVVQALCAAALRAGLLEVIYQGQPIRNPSDARLDQVFTALPRFRSAGFRPPAGTDVPLEKRVELARKLEQFGHAAPGHSTDALAASVREVFLPAREATIRVEAGLGGLGISAPESVTRTRALFDRLASDDDDDIVTTARDTWADLVTGIAAVARVDDLLQTHLGELRIAQLESRKSPEGLPEELSAEHAELRDLLAAGDLDDHAARIIAIARRLTETRRAATEESAAKLSATLAELQAQLREQFRDDEAALSEALRPIEALAPPDDLAGVDASALDARIDSARARAQTAATQLEELRAAGRLAWIRVSDLVTDAIVEEAEIDPVLKRIGEAIAEQLADGKQVRLQ